MLRRLGWSRSGRRGLLDLLRGSRPLSEYSLFFPRLLCSLFRLSKSNHCSSGYVSGAVLPSPRLCRQTDRNSTTGAVQNSDCRYAHSFGAGCEQR